jgi:xanthine/CO dehydrogenase XdhC/CoxF family maturation factor
VVTIIAVAAAAPRAATTASTVAASGLTFGRIGAQDLEPAVSGLRGGLRGQRRLTRAGRPGDREQPAGAACGAFQQAVDLL